MAMKREEMPIQRGREVKAGEAVSPEFQVLLQRVRTEPGALAAVGVPGGLATGPVGALIALLFGTSGAQSFASSRHHVRREASQVRNSDALASYLFGILSPLPLLGVLFGVLALVLGARGLRYAREHPGAGGALQCRIGMTLGGFFAAVYLVLIGYLLAVLYL